MSLGKNCVLDRGSARKKAKRLAKIRKEPGKSNAGKYPNVKKFAGPDVRRTFVES